MTDGVYVAWEPCHKLIVEGGDHATVKLDSELERVSVRLLFQVPIVATVSTDSAVMLTTTDDCCPAGPSPTSQLTADDTAGRVAAVVLHAAVACTR